MKTLLGIIFFHVLVIISAKTSRDEESFPVITTAVITLMLTGFVVLMMFTMEEPEP